MPRASHAYELTFVTPHLAVGHAPMTHEQLDSLKAQGIGAILNLCAEFCDLHDIEAQAGFEVYYLPIPDEEAPPLPELEKALAWLDEAVYLGRKVL
ncbi:MAG: dual specificity protein phosphatase family protein, partial [Desulfovibrio sp.]|nr:dual specificity protein phosphatase family protein [Desulfovibrio sp.]